MGDRMEDVVAKWGPPEGGRTGGPGIAMFEYPAGSWALTVIIHKNKVADLALGPYTAPREFVPDA